jgi:uncharacterized membrane protein YbhN (UPF0104 family)
MLACVSGREGGVNDTEPIEAIEPKRYLTWKSVLRAVISLAVIGAIFFWALPKFADYSAVWAEMRSMTWLEVATLILVGLWNLATYWIVMVSVLPGLTYPQAAVVNQASTAVSNTLPGGGALGVGVSYAIYHSWGFTTSEFALATVVSGVWNNFAKLGFPVIALALLAITGDANAGFVTAGLLGVGVLATVIVVFGLMLRKDSAARKIGDWAGRAVSAIRGWFRKAPITGWGESAARFSAQTAGLIHDRWVRITVSAVVSHLSLYFVLLISLRHVGISEEELGWVTVLAGFAFVRLISALPITPGGVGLVELGYAVYLTQGLTDAQSAQVVAAMLVFRFITFVLPIPNGIAAYLYWQKNRSWRKTPEERQAEMRAAAAETG